MFFDIRRGEIRKTLLMTASVLVIIASYTMVKTVRDAVFLAKFDTADLARVNLLVAATAGLFTAVATRAARRLPRNQVILAAHAIIAATLLILWFALRSRIPGAPWVLYIWSAFFGLFSLANFWLLANELYDARSAKRLFALLGAGAILGGVVGGEVSRALAHGVGALAMLPVIATGFLVAAGLAHGAWCTVAHHDERGKERGSGEKVGFGAGFRTLRRDAYLQVIAAILLLATVATTLIDFQVKEVAKAHFHSNRDAMAGFFGRLTALLSLTSLFVQLFITPAFLRRFGVGRALMGLPLALVLGASVVALNGTLALSALTAVALAKIGDGGLRFSLDKAAMELLYLPVSPRIKSRAKPVIDTVIDRLGTGLSAGLWLVVVWAVPAAIIVTTAALVTLGLLGIWLGLIVLLRRRYVEAFRAVLPAPKEPHAVPVDTGDPNQLAALGAALRSPDENTLIVALDVLVRLPRPPPLDETQRLVDHPSSAVRTRARALIAATRNVTNRHTPAPNRYGAVRRLILDLGEEDRRPSALAALEAFDSGIVPVLAASLDDRSLPLRVRLKVPGIMAEVAAQPAADALLAFAGTSDEARLRGTVLRVLERLQRSARVQIEQEPAQSLVIAEARVYRQHAEALRAQERGRKTPGSRLLRRALGEAAATDLERLFCALALVRPGTDVVRAWRGLVSGDPAVRASALELLDNVLPVTVRRELLDLIDRPVAVAVAVAADIVPPRTVTLTTLASDSDPWLRTCAEYVMSEDENHPEDERMSTIEKVLFLQRVPLLSELPTDALAHVASVAQAERREAGEKLWRAGDSADEIYFVVDGLVRLAGDVLLGSGSDVGVKALLGHDGVRDSDALAVRPTLLLRVTRDGFFEVLGEHPEVARAVLETVGTRLRSEHHRPDSGLGA